MSASLVGSEMCIRDRRKGASVRPDNSPPSTTSSGCRRRRMLFESWLAAVSYTHLTLPTICSV
eukprot:14705929-Alexandrium_andersonii.AAC.1